MLILVIDLSIMEIKIYANKLNFLIIQPKLLLKIDCSILEINISNTEMVVLIIKINISRTLTEISTAGINLSIMKIKI